MRYGGVEYKVGEQAVVAEAAWCCAAAIAALPTPEHKEQRKWVPGRAIELRLVVAQVRNEAAQS